MECLQSDNIPIAQFENEETMENQENKFTHLYLSQHVNIIIAQYEHQNIYLYE